MTGNALDGRNSQLHKRGQQIRLTGLKSSVHVSWYYFKREDGKWEKRYVLCTKTLKASTITWWGRRRWQIQGFFQSCQIPLWSRSFWSIDSVGSLQMVGSILDSLFASSRSLISIQEEEIYQIGVRLHKKLLNSCSH